MILLAAVWASFRADPLPSIPFLLKYPLSFFFFLVNRFLVNRGLEGGYVSFLDGFYILALCVL